MTANGIDDRQALCEAFALPNRCDIVLVSLFEAVCNFYGFPTRHMQMRPFTEDPVEKTGRR